MSSVSPAPSSILPSLKPSSPPLDYATPADLSLGGLTFTHSPHPDGHGVGVYLLLSELSVLKHALGSFPSPSGPTKKVLEPSGLEGGLGLSPSLPILLAPSSLHHAGCCCCSCPPALPMCCFPVPKLLLPLCPLSIWCHRPMEEKDGG